jgi:hypothetical protein
VQKWQHGRAGRLADAPSPFVQRSTFRLVHGDIPARTRLDEIAVFVNL